QCASQHFFLPTISEEASRCADRLPGGLLDFHAHRRIQHIDVARGVTEEKEGDALEDSHARELVDVANRSQRGLEGGVQTCLFPDFPLRTLGQGLARIGMSFGESPDGAATGADESNLESIPLSPHDDTASGLLVPHPATIMSRPCDMRCSLASAPRR